MSSRRRSSRANKGQHSKRSLDDLYEYGEDEEARSELMSKKSHTENDDEDGDYQAEETNKDEEINSSGDDSNDDDEDEVRCTPCGTNKDNYNEETDEGGMMIQCDSCKTWQHARCMGFKSTREIPKKYICNECDKSIKPKHVYGQKDKWSIENLRDRHRLSSAKAFLAFFRKAIPESYSLPKGFGKERLANKWTLDLEKVIYEHAPKKYNEESRRILFLIKKPSVIKQVIDGELKFDKLVKSSPEEIDPDLKQYAEKVRQESIRRSVLTADESQGQRIRRTHKGEEIVEDVNAPEPDLDSNIINRHVERSETTEGHHPSRDIIVNDSNRKKYINYNSDEDEDDNNNNSNDTETEANNDGSSFIKRNENGFNGESKTEDTEKIAVDQEGESNNEDSIPDLEEDEDLQYIITGKRSSSEARNEDQKPKRNLPQLLETHIWDGAITFPDFASFNAKAEFYSCSGYQLPTTADAANLHNRFIRTSRAILLHPRYEVEGRLDADRAVSYLNKIVSTRDLFLVHLEPTENYDDFKRLLGYLADRKKVGVLSGKPSFVKDSYLFPVDFSSYSLPDFLKPFRKDGTSLGLYALFVVKKDYVPPAPGILKKKTVSFAQESDTGNSQLSSILKQLNEGSSSLGDNISINSSYVSEKVDFSDKSKGILSNLTQDQRRILEDVCRQNPQIAENPEAYFNLLQSYLVNGNTSIATGYQGN